MHDSGAQPDGSGTISSVSALPGLTPVAWLHPSLDTAQRFLAGAYDSVSAVLDNLDVVRKARSVETRGRLRDSEIDLLRAGVVFAGAGVDAALKQLVRDSLPPLLLGNEKARSEFTAYVAAQLNRDQTSKLLARYLTADSPREALIEGYIRELTGSSLQSVEQVLHVASALAVNEKPLRTAILTLQNVFVARNEISHELDLREPARHGDKRRRPRTIAETTDLCHRALDVTQRILNEVGSQLT